MNKKEKTNRLITVGESLRYENWVAKLSNRPQGFFLFEDEAIVKEKSRRCNGD